MQVPDLSQVPEPQRYILGAFLSILDVIRGFEKKFPLSDQDKQLYLSAQECRRNLDEWNKLDELSKDKGFYDKASEKLDKLS